MDKMDRRAAKAQWRERKEDWAIASVRIGAGVWLKLTPDPASFENRVRFMLRQGAGLGGDMQTAWTDTQAITVEVVERLDPNLSALARERVGAARLAHWAEILGARII